MRIDKFYYDMLSEYGPNKMVKNMRRPYFKRHHPATGHWEFLGHSIRSVIYKKRVKWYVVDHPGIWSITKDACCWQLWYEYIALVAEVIEIEKYEKRKCS